jgi:hypothetical protein
MITRKHYLATAAGVALALALSAPTIAAETGPNGPQVSTPAEKAQTQSLNTQQQNGSYVDPAVANGQATAANPVPGEQVAAAASNTANTDAQYQQQQAQYQGAQAQYSAEMDAYVHQRAAYDWQRRHPETWWRYRYEHAGYIAVETIPRPDLMSVAVTDRTGFLVGHIDDIASLPDGKIVRVRLKLNDNRMAWIEGSAVRYYPADKLLMVDLTPSQIWQRSAPI